MCNIYVVFPFVRFQENPTAGGKQEVEFLFLAVFGIPLFHERLHPFGPVAG